MMKILVIDGSVADRRTIVEVLDELTNVVVQGAVADLDSGRRAIAECGPDVIVTELELPGGDAFAVLETSRRRSPPPHVIVFTALGDDETERRCREAGATAYLSKQLGVHALVEMVGKLERTRLAAADDPECDTFRLLGRMTAGVAHDLNNYLAVLRVSLDLLEQRGPDPYLWERAHEAVDAATELNRNLLQYARGAAPDPAAIELGALVRRALELIGRLIKPNIVVIVDAGSAPLPPVRGVAPELEQLVLNLVLNACDAMPDGGELRLRLRAPGPSAVVLEVLDTGSGLRGDAAGARSPSSKAARPGCGLGLGIVRSVVERHYGAVRISAREGGGTSVTVVLPRWHEP